MVKQLKVRRDEIQVSLQNLSRLRLMGNPTGRHLTIGEWLQTEARYLG
jgi:hypothetical protein